MTKPTQSLATLLLTCCFALAAAFPVSAQEKALIVAFQPQESIADLSPDAERLADFLSAELDRPVRVYLPTSYSAVVEAMRSGHADIAYFSARPFTIAQSLANAEALVAEVRNGENFYYSKWFVRRDSNIERLADLRGKRAAFTSPTSTSGYLFPYAKLVQEGLLEPKQAPDAFFSEYIFAGGYQQALMALVHEQVDAAAVSDYAFDRYLTPEQQGEIEEIAQQGPVPTHLIAVRGELPEPLKLEIRRALMELNTPANRSLLMDVYGAESLVPVDNSHVNALREALELTGIEPVPGESFENIGGPATPAGERAILDPATPKDDLLLPEGEPSDLLEPEAQDDDMLLPEGEPSDQLDPTQKATEEL